MKFKSVLLTFAVILVNYAECARILGVFPMTGVSHYILCSKLMKGLVAAGHDITMVSPFPMEDVPKNGVYTDIVLDGSSERFYEMMQSINMYEMDNKNPFTMMKMMTDTFLDYTNNTFYHPNVQKLLKSDKKFDAVILEQFSNDALKVFAQIYDCPLILLSSIGVNSWNNYNLLVGNLQPVSFAGHLMSGDFSHDLSFVNRAKHLLFYMMDYLVTNLYMLPAHDEIMHQAFPDSPPLSDLYANVSLFLLNSDLSLYPALSLVPNMVEIGGYFIDPPQKLPNNLQEFLDNATEGVIYFSMGSNLKSKDMPQERKKLILNVLGKLKEKVLWKFEEDLPDKPSNVMIQKWTPQQDILAHPNIKLFITHGGLLSTTETIYHGVPVLAIPVFGDQNSNADIAVSNGFGLKLNYNSPEFTEETLSRLIDELLHNKLYKENAQRRSKIYHDRLVSPMKNAVYWIEYVIRHKGAPHLRVAGVKLSLYKYLMLDVLGAIALMVFGVFVTLKCIFKKLFFGAGSSDKIKKQKN